TRGEDASAGVGRARDTLGAGVGVRAGDEGRALRMGKLHVGNELPAPAQVARVLLAQKRRADARGGVRDGARHGVVFWSIAPANAARSRTFQACTGALSTRGVGTRLLDFARKRCQVRDHGVASSMPCFSPWAALSFAATARRSILPAPLSGSVATMSTKRGCE